MTKFKIALLLVGCGTAVYAVDYLATQPDEVYLAQQEYCEMVKLGLDSFGQYGWPDFNKNYLKVCPKPKPKPTLASILK